jgi:hypothetical protein
MLKESMRRACEGGLTFRSPAKLVRKAVRTYGRLPMPRIPSQWPEHARMGCLNGVAGNETPVFGIYVSTIQTNFTFFWGCHMASEERERVRETVETLVQRIQEEQDPKKFTGLIERLNEVLDERSHGNKPDK